MEEKGGVTIINVRAISTFGVWLIAAIICTVASAQSMDKVKVAASFVGLLDTSQPSFCKQRGEFEKVGLDVEIISTRGGTETVQAVVAGGNDVGYSPGISAVLAAYVKGAAIRIVTSEFIGQNDSFFYVETDGPIKSVNDLVGKSVAYPRPGGSTENVLLGFKEQTGLNWPWPPAVSAQPTRC